MSYIKPESAAAEDLEALVDAHGLSNVLAALSDICAAKAAHVEEYWQDKQTARMWQRAGTRLSACADLPAIKDLD